MISLSRLVTVAALSIAIVPSPSAFAGTPATDAKTPTVDLGNQAWTQPLFGGGIKTNDVYTDGNIFFTVPVWSTLGRDGSLGGDYLFLEPYSSVGDQGEVAASLGLSWRHLFSHESVDALHKQGKASFMEEGWFVGGNVFLDMLDTQHNNNFWQMGVGAEAGTRYFEVRGNYYIPMTGEKLYDRLVNTQTSVSRSASTVYNTVTDFHADPFATGNSIVQGTTSQTFATSSIATTTTTVRTVTELFEKGMEGWDAEASVLVPWLDQWMDLRLIGGYFSFNNQPFGPQNGPTGPVHGWKAGAELRPVPAVVLGGMWYEDKRFVGSSWIVSAELQIPMDKTWKDAFKMRRRHLVEHLAEPVHRQNDAIKVGNREDQQTTVSSSTSVQRVTKVLVQTTGQIVLKDDVVFVNNGGAVGNGIQAGSATGDGTAESPVTTIQAGSTMAQANSNNTQRVWNVYTQGSGKAYTGTVSASTGSVNFIGSGAPIQGANGKLFGNNIGPTLTGDFQASRIGVFGVKGYGIISTVPGHAAIGVTDVGVVNLDGNVITNPAGPGINVTYVLRNGPGSVSITNNSVSGAQGAGITVANNTVAFPLSATVSNNLLTNNTGDGIAVISTGTVPTLVASVTHNAVFQSGGNGISLQSTGTAPIWNADVSQNLIVTAGADGIAVNASGNSPVMTLTMSNNNIQSTGGAGISLSTQATDPVVTATIAGNTIAHPLADGLRITTGGNSPTINVTVVNNIFQAVNGDGIHIGGGGTIAQVNAQITSNQIQGVTGNGIAVLGAGLGATITHFDLNAISFYGADGLLFSAGFSPMSINGTLGSSFANSIDTPDFTQLRLNSVNNPTGSFYLNSSQVNLPTDVP